MKKILVTSTDMMMMQFLIPHVQYLRKQGFDVEVACSEVGNRLEEVKKKLGEDKVYKVRLQRNPVKLSNLKGLTDLKKIIDNGSYDLIWTNEPVMGIMTRLAAKKARKKGANVVYMAHGFHFYKGAPKKNWLTFYPIEKHFAKKCDVVITITEEDYRLASKKFKTKVIRMHGAGVDGDRHVFVGEEQKFALREELEFGKEEFICLCVGELNANKNQRQIVASVPNLKAKIPGFRLVLAGKGKTKEELEAQIKELGVEKEVILVGYQPQIEKYVRAADVVLSASKREGLPFNIVEAMLTKRPVVVSENRGHRELIKDGETGFITNDVSKFEDNIIRLFEDKELYSQIVERAYDYAKAYTLQSTIKEFNIILE